VVGLIVILLLLVAAVIGWVAVVAKRRQLVRCRRRDRRLGEDLERAASPLVLFPHMRRYEGSVSGDLYERACQSAAYHLLGSTSPDANFVLRLQAADRMAPSQLRGVGTTVDAAVLEGAAKLNCRRLDRIGLIVRCAPFVGLLGTVWTLVVTVASGRDVSSVLAIALLPLAVSLLVSVPLQIAHGILSRRVREVIAALAELGAELLTRFDQVYVQHGRRYDSLPSISALAHGGTGGRRDDSEQLDSLFRPVDPAAEPELPFADLPPSGNPPPMIPADDDALNTGPSAFSSEVKFGSGQDDQSDDDTDPDSSELQNPIRI